MTMQLSMKFLNSEHSTFRNRSVSDIHQLFYPYPKFYKWICVPHSVRVCALPHCHYNLCKYSFVLQCI